MLKIWARPNSINVQKVMWTVSELGLEAERTDAGMEFGVVSEPWFETYNPNRLVPTIDDDGFVLWESNVIVRYLAAKYSLGELMPSEPQTRATAEMWMDWQQTAIIPDLGPLFRSIVRMAPSDRDHDAIESAAKKVTAGLRMLDDHLAGRAYLMGDRFTIADIPLGCAGYRWYSLYIPHPDFPNVAAGYERLTARPGFATHVMLPLT